MLYCHEYNASAQWETGVPLIKSMHYGKLLVVASLLFPFFRLHPNSHCFSHGPLSVWGDHLHLCPLSENLFHPIYKGHWFRGTGAQYKKHITNARATTQQKLALTDVENETGQPLLGWQLLYACTEQFFFHTRLSTWYKSLGRNYKCIPLTWIATRLL